MYGLSCNLTFSTIDYSPKLRFVNNAGVILRNNIQNITLASAFGNQVSGSPSTAGVTFTGASASYYTNIMGNNTWSNPTTLGQNAYVRIGHANSLGTASSMTFAT